MPPIIPSQLNLKNKTIPDSYSAALHTALKKQLITADPAENRIKTTELIDTLLDDASSSIDKTFAFQELSSRFKDRYAENISYNIWKNEGDSIFQGQICAANSDVLFSIELQLTPEEREAVTAITLWNTLSTKIATADQERCKALIHHLVSNINAPGEIEDDPASANSRIRAFQEIKALISPAFADEFSASQRVHDDGNIVFTLDLTEENQNNIFFPLTISFPSAAAPTLKLILQHLEKLNPTKINDISADSLNQWWKEKMGYNEPPYTPGQPAREFILKETTRFARVYDNTYSYMAGGWVLRAQDIIGLSSKEIQNRFALPHEPKYIADADIPGGTTMRIGQANGLFSGSGGGIQFDLAGERTGHFHNERQLPIRR